eukprot:TRINITY_DN4312_c0_g1_i1.p1 TRINITY_DN4312_c0_g1~~TRINITY_DN4312_c0_g1_i1.p1  ORF type:complete len:388 (-),score=75.30 TRINITY_DN4312_c0_g1_i1:972-2135(-)
MGKVGSNKEQIERLRERTAVLRGVSSVKKKTVEITSQLFTLFHQLEVSCPRLAVYFHVSGVSRTNSESFFLVVYDAAVLAAGDETKRVLKSVYTHLHSESSMMMRAALFRADMARRSAPLSGDYARPLVQAAASQAVGKVGSSDVLSPIVSNMTADSTDLAASAGGDRQGGVDGAAPAPAGAATNDCRNVTLGQRTLHGHVVPPDWAPSDGGVAEDPEAEEFADEGNVLSAGGNALSTPQAADASDDEVDEFAAAGVGFDPPAVHVPSDAANEAVELLFTAIKDGSGGWVGLLRATFAAVIIALVSRRALSSKAKLQGMLVWWPREQSSRNVTNMSAVKRGRRGGEGNRLSPLPYPVAVQQRHIPPNERSRDYANVEDVKYITLTEV